MPTRPRSRCPRCKQLHDGKGRCSKCRTPGAPTTASRTAADRKRRAQAVSAHRSRYGDVCPGYERAPHPGGDLTADHVDPGDPASELRVLCRSCNSSRGGKLGATKTNRRTG